MSWLSRKLRVVVDALLEASDPKEQSATEQPPDTEILEMELPVNEVSVTEVPVKGRPKSKATGKNVRRNPSKDRRLIETPEQQARIDALQDAWMKAWPEALACWSTFVKLRPPVLCRTHQQAHAEGLTRSFAMISLANQTVVVNLAMIDELDLGDYPLEVLAHEIGHHVLAPATLSDHIRLLARIRAALPTLEQFAPSVANMYADLLVNDRLQRSANLHEDQIYRRLAETEEDAPSKAWTLYLRIFELLWKLEKGSLGSGPTDETMEIDAWLGMRVVRVYNRDWLKGAGRFAALLLPYLVDDAGGVDALALQRADALLDTKSAGAGGQPYGVIDCDFDEQDNMHPALDPLLSASKSAKEGPPGAPRDQPTQASAGQRRDPFAYGELLRAAGLVVDDHEMAVRYYRELAQPHLIKFPTRVSLLETDPVPEGLEPWSFGESFDTLDLFETLLQNPTVVPGFTTVQRTYGTSAGSEPKRTPIDLDVYVDSSGSMPNPQSQLSFPALAGAIICCSALRTGSRVQVTLWSNKDQSMSTPGFVRDESQILRVLTGYYGGGTQFPIHVMRNTYKPANKLTHPVHILHISDDGIDTMFENDELGNSGMTIAKRAMERGGAGGTMALQTSGDWAKYDHFARVVAAQKTQGWKVHPVATLEDLVDFAKHFVREHYDVLYEPNSEPNSETKNGTNARTTARVRS
jgi:hypothetical protein